MNLGRILDIRYVSFLLTYNNITINLAAKTQHIFIISQFLGVRSLGMAYLNPLPRVSRGYNKGIGQGLLSIWQSP